MKKVLSVILALALLVTCGLPIAVSAAKVSCPVIYVGGQNSVIYSDKNNAESETYFTDFMPEEALSNINSQLRPALTKAILGSWDDYLNGFYETALPYYSEIVLDNNGLPTNDTGYDCLKEAELVNKAVNGRYNLKDYVFVYDWRLDPCANAEELNAYINEVLGATGARKVSVVAVGIGCGTVLAYLQAYGSDKINELVLDNAALNGSDVYGAFFSNSIEQDPDALAVFVAQVRRNNTLLQVIKSYVDAENWDSFASVKATRKVYGKLYETSIPRLYREVYGTMPGFWSLIGDSYYEDAIDFIFADYRVKEEKAVLLEKINNYHYNVQQKTAQILNNALENGVNIYNIVNYGFQMVPVNENSVYTSDVYVSVVSATLGATAAPYGTSLGDAYAAGAAQNNAADFISPDGEIDAATGFIPAHTWFVKNLENGETPNPVNELIVSILNFNGYTNVFDLENAPQYLYCSNDRSALTSLAKQNEDDTQAGEEGQQDEGQFSGLTGLFNLIRKIADAIARLVRNLISFGQSAPFSSQFEDIGKEPVTEPAP